jgi:hypothetical protein
MTEIRTEIEIEASAGRVWKVLTDFAAYAEWNPLIPVASGEIKPGARLKFRARLWDGVALRLQPTVVVAEAGRELRWRDQLLFPALFAAEHSLFIEPRGEQRVRFIHREVYSGFLRPLVLLIIASNNRRRFSAMDRALKTRAELHS